MTFETARGGLPGLYSPVLGVVPTLAAAGLTNSLNISGGASIIDSPVGIFGAAPNSAGNQFRGVYGPAPTPPYSRTFLINVSYSGGNNTSAGFGWYNGTDKLHVLVSYSQPSAPYIQVEVERWASVSSFASADGTTYSNTPLFWGKITDDGTNVIFSLSYDGANFITIYTVSKASGYLGSSGYSNLVFFVNGKSMDVYATLMALTG